MNTCVLTAALIKAQQVSTRTIALKKSLRINTEKRTRRHGYIYMGGGYSLSRSTRSAPCQSLTVATWPSFSILTALGCTV